MSLPTSSRRAHIWETGTPGKPTDQLAEEEVRRNASEGQSMRVLIDVQVFKILRSQRHLTLENLANESGVSIATIKRIEGSKGSYTSYSKTAERLASAFQVEIVDLAYDGLPLALDVGGDIEARLDKSTTENEIREGAEQLVRLLKKRLNIISRA